MAHHLPPLRPLEDAPPPELFWHRGEVEGFEEVIRQLEHSLRRVALQAI